MEGLLAPGKGGPLPFSQFSATLSLRQEVGTGWAGRCGRGLSFDMLFPLLVP